MRSLVLLLVLASACATDPDDDYQCEVDCPEPPLVIIHVEDLRAGDVTVTSTLVFEEGRPSFPTVKVMFQATLPTCAVVNHDVEVSLAGQPGHVVTYGGPYRQAFRWHCNPFVMTFAPTVHQADAKVLVSDATGSIELDLGDALVERTLVPIDHPDWVFPASQPAAFRWHPAQDLDAQNAIGLLTYLTLEAVPGPVAVPFTSLDNDGAFQLVIPPIAGTQVLRLQVGRQRSCGPACSLTMTIAGDHTARTM